MADRKVYCGETAIEVRRWLRPSVEIVAGAMVPFMVSKSDAQFVRDHTDEPFVLRGVNDVDGWSLEIISVESAGTDGIWVSAKAISRISRAPQPLAKTREHSSTLMGMPVPGVDDDS